VFPLAAFLLALLALTPAILQAQDAGGPESEGQIVTKADASHLSHPWIFSTAHGLAVGRGQPSYNGLHLQDSLSVTARQNGAGGRLSEDFSASTNEGLVSSAQPGSLQDWDAGLALKYKRAGSAVGAEGGVTYAAILYNKLTRKVKQKTKAEATTRYGLSASQAFSLDADSTWEADLAVGFDELTGTFRTLDFSTGLTKTLGDFELNGLVTGFHQDQNLSTVVCTGKGSKSCSDSTSQSSSRGFGISADGGWDNDTHAITIKTGMDWQFAADVERTVLMGLGYIYSPAQWIDIGADVQRENNLDVKKNAKVWLAAVSVRLTF